MKQGHVGQDIVGDIFKGDDGKHYNCYFLFLSYTIRNASVVNYLLKFGFFLNTSTLLLLSL